MKDREAYEICDFFPVAILCLCLKFVKTGTSSGTRRRIGPTKCNQYIKYGNLWIINNTNFFLLVRSCEDRKSFLLQLDNLECLSVTLKIPTCMFPYYYVATACGCQGSGRLKLENGLTVLTDTTIKILPERKIRSVTRMYLRANWLCFLFHLLINTTKLKIMTHWLFLKVSTWNSCSQKILNKLSLI